MPLIHQIALGDNIPEINRVCLNSWHKLTDRDFHIVSWTDQRIRDDLAISNMVLVQKLLEAARNYGEASDILRMAIAYSYGGLYVDWDVLLSDADKFLTIVGDLEATCCVLIQDRFTIEPTFPCTYDNSVFYMRKGNPLALDFLSQVEQNYLRTPLADSPFVTGPLALTSFLDSRADYKNSCRSIDTLDLYAFDYKGFMARTERRVDRDILEGYCQSSGAPAVHLWTHAWVPKRRWPQRLVDKVLRTFKKATGAR